MHRQSETVEPKGYDGRFSRRSTLLSILPSGLFLAANAIGGVVAGVLIATIAALTVIAVRRSRGSRVGMVLPITLAYVVIRGAVAVATQSEDVYFAFGLTTNLLFAGSVLISAFTATPAALRVIPLFVVYSAETRNHPLYARVASQVTALWAGAELSLTAWEASHLRTTSANEFIVLRTFVGWPAMFCVVFFLVFYLRLRLDIIERSTETQSDVVFSR